MKKNRLLTLLILFLSVIIFVACDEKTPTGSLKEPTNNQITEQPTENPPTEIPTENPPTEIPTEKVDYASSVVLDYSTESIKVNVNVRLFVDGDTTHFNISDQSFNGNILKARYLAVNTPESTGDIEPWGKTAANFTKEKLQNATSIVVESDNAFWNADSTGGRFMVWVWYRTSDTEPYRNLNIELLQEGLAIASNSEQNRYGEVCGRALAQARAFGLCCHSSQPDPNFYYGDAHEITLKKLRTNIEEYEGQKVAFEGVVYRDNSQTVYIEDYDEETGIYYGITVYYGYSASGKMLEILSVGNRVRIVGTVSLYEAAGTYQVSGLSYRMMRPNDPSNIQLIESGFEGAYTELVPEDLRRTITIEEETDEGVETQEFSFMSLAMNTSVSMKNLEVIDIYTTNNEESSSNGAMTITCRVGSETITIRTIVLRDASGKIITADKYLDKTIDVKGMVDYYNGDYQIKVFSANDITIKN